MTVNQEKPALTVRVGDREYNAWADGRVEGFGDGDAPITIFNRIPILIREAERQSGVSGQDVRLTCVSFAMGAVSGPNVREAVELADALAQYVLTGSKPSVEG